MRNERRECHGVIETAITIYRNTVTFRLQGWLHQCNGNDTGQYNDQRHQHFGNGCHDGGALCSAHVLGDHGSLYHEEVSTPVPERHDKTKTEDERHKM